MPSGSFSEKMRSYLLQLATDKRRDVLSRVLTFVLLLLSWLYGSVVRILSGVRRLKRHRIQCVVISVGNITLGGTGKTPLVELIAKRLKAYGHSVAVLSRGYQKAGLLPMGDEPTMLAQRLPGVSVFVDSNRVRGAKRAIRENAVDTVLLDDGFQQWGIRKDLEIVVIDAVSGFGNRQMLPRGILREPLSALRRADVFVLTKTDLCKGVGRLKEELLRRNPAALIVEAVHKPAGVFHAHNLQEEIPLQRFAKKPFAVFCGIGDPLSFERLVETMGLRIGFSRRFPDHHRYTAGDWADLMRRAEEKGIDDFLTTEKDAVRIAAAPFNRERGRLYILKIEMRLTNHEEQFFSRLSELYPL